MKQLDKFGLMIAKHDVYYFYADDFKVWRKGNREYGEIEAFYKGMSKPYQDQARDMWNTMINERYKGDEGLKWKAT